MFGDLRHSARALLRDKAWTAVVVLSLALGIGANAALFSAINSMFLRKLPVRDPDTLVRLRWAGRNDMVTDSSDYGFSGLGVRSTFSYAMFREFAADNRTMDDVFACAPVFSKVSVAVDGQAEAATAFVSSGNYYRVLGLTANPGRTIEPSDDRPTAAPVAVISAPYWRRRFGADPRIVGKSILLNNASVTIVGVISPDLIDVQQAVREGPDIAAPLSLVPQLANTPAGRGEPNIPLLERPTYWWLQVMGRLRPGVTAAHVQANLEPVFQHTARAGLDAYLASLPPEVRAESTHRNRRDVPRLRVEPGSRGIYDTNTSDARSVTILSVVVVLVLLIVCANVANLLLSRASTRQREISVRLSLGATRARLVGQLLTESVLLAAAGGALGILVGRWGQQLLPVAAGQIAPFDWRVLTFVVTVAAATSIVSGIVPALRATGMNVSAALKETNRSVMGTRSVLSRALLVLQVAISIVLLIAAGLFLRTLQNLRSVDVGFNTRNLVVFRIVPMLNRYDDARTIALYGRLIDRLRGVPGVQSVALSNHPLLAGSSSSTFIFIQGRASSPGQTDSINRLVISPDYFSTMEMPLRQGRGFTDRDDQNAPKVAVINETAVRKYFPNENPIGRRFGSTIETAGQLEIVGVLRDAKYDSVRDPAPPTMYVPYLQQPRTSQTIFQLRTSGDPIAAVGAIREAVRQIDPNLPLMDVSTQLDTVEKRLKQERIFAQAYSLFGGLALLLASIGLFGLMSYSVARRTNEVGIRMALGARARDVLTLVMRESMTLVAVGVVIGVVTAMVASRLVTTLLFGLAATDTLTIATAVIVMFVVSGFAGYLPARRAARVDPLVALRYE
jgi:predicted permease